MPEFFSYGPDLRYKQRKQAFRFGLPVVMFLILFAVMFGAVHYAHQNEREQTQAKLIADTLWARQNLQFQVDGLRKALQSIARDSLIYYSDNFNSAARQVARSNTELVVVFKGQELVLEPGTLSNLPTDTVSYIQGILRDEVAQHIESGADGVLGPFSLRGQSYLAFVSAGLGDRAAVVGVVDLGRMLDTEMPWWFAQKNQVDLLSSTGATLASLVKGEPSAGVFEHATSLDLGGLPLTLWVGSGASGPEVIGFGVTGAVVLLLVLLLLSVGLLWRDSKRRLVVESKLQEEKLFRQAMQDSIALGMRVWDLQGIIRYVNPAFCNMVGYSSEKLVGATFPLPYWPENNAEEYHSLVTRVISGNSPSKGFETEYQHRDGRRIYVLIVEAPLRNADGVHVGWMSSVLDITDRKQSEALIAHQREQLQAASRFALVGEVASNIAHELNQPLGSMVSFAQAGVNISRKGAPVEKYVELFTKLRDQAQRANRVIRSVQNLVRRRKPMRESISVIKLVNSIRPSLERIARMHWVNLVFELHDPSQVLFLDRIMVEQVLENLVKNASEAFEPGQAQRKVIVRTEVADGHFALHVLDNGPGIAIPNLELMLETLVSTKPDGLGLGLSLCRSVAEAHGGRLSVEPVEQGGTHFIITLPMAVQQIERKDHVDV